MVVVVLLLEEALEVHGGGRSDLLAADADADADAAAVVVVDDVVIFFLCG